MDYFVSRSTLNSPEPSLLAARSSLPAGDFSTSSTAAAAPELCRLANDRACDEAS